MQSKPEPSPQEEPSNIVALPHAAESAPASRFSAPENFINRELSWLEFNRRVLEEAQDPTQPLIERVKFLTIFSGNLDEFFEIRVAGIKQQIESETSDVGPDGLSPTETFNAIQRTVSEMVATEYALWKEELTPLLAKNGIRIHDVAALNANRTAWAHRYFQEEVFPLLTPLAVDASHPFPQLLNKSHNLLVRARNERGGELLHAIVQVPRVLPRLILMPRGKGEDEPWEYIYLSSLIKHHIADLFPGLLLDGAHAFRVTRNSDLYIDEEEADNLLRSIEQELRRSSRGDAVRLEVEADCPKDFRELLLEFFDLGEMDLYKVDGPLSMTHLAPLVANDAFAKLKDRVFQPARDPALPPHVNIFEVMRKQDVLLHHPYESFDPIVELIEDAARDPQVLALKITQEVAIVFNTLTGLASYPGLEKLMVAPFDLSKRVIAMIERERDLALSGKTGRIVVKLNSLVDQQIIEKLYEASCAGVKIDLIVRGICCLRPHMPNLSENIRVISIVGRFLEHSRVYYFENAGQADIYLSSADWMPRNFYRRLEIAFPIDAPALREEMVNDILPSLLNDQVKARELQPDGSYVRLQPAEGAARSQAQLHFRERSRQARKAAAELQAKSGIKLIPIKAKRDQRKRA